MPGRRPNEVSAGGVVARPAPGGWEVCLVRAGRYWGFPKGNLEPGETPQRAALREIGEECGLEVANLKIAGDLPPSEYAYRRRDGRLIFKTVHQFLVLVPADSVATPQPGEIDELAWLSLVDAAARASFPATRAALRAAAGLLPRPPRLTASRA